MELEGGCLTTFNPGSANIIFEVEEDCFVSSTPKSPTSALTGTRNNESLDPVSVPLKANTFDFKYAVGKMFYRVTEIRMWQNSGISGF